MIKKESKATKQLSKTPGATLSKEQKAQIHACIKKVISEYGTTLRLLGEE